MKWNQVIGRKAKINFKKDDLQNYNMFTKFLEKKSLRIFS